MSPERPNAELAYLAWEAFLWNPDMTVEEFLDHHARPGRTEARAIQHRLEFRGSIFFARTDDHAFARGQSRRLHDYGQTMLAQKGAGGVEVGEDLKPSGRNSGRKHHFLGKGFVALDPRPALPGAEDLKALPFELVRRAGHQWCLRSDYCQVDLLPESESGKTGQVHR